MIQQIVPHVTPYHLHWNLQWALFNKWKWLHFQSTKRAIFNTLFHTTYPIRQKYLLLLNSTWYNHCLLPLVLSPRSTGVTVIATDLAAITSTLSVASQNTRVILFFLKYQFAGLYQFDTSLPVLCLELQWFLLFTETKSPSPYRAYRFHNVCLNLKLIYYSVSLHSLSPAS